MKIKELIKLLEKMDGELEVYKSSDDEGNSFTIVDSVESNLFTFNSGDYKIESLYDEEDCNEYMGMLEKIAIVW